MESWLLDIRLVDLMVDATILGVALVLATVLRRHSRLLQRYLVPNALVAGFLGLLFGPELIGMINISTARMGAYVYHLLALTFICVGLKAPGGRRSFAAVHLGFMQVMCLLLQAMIGLAIALAFHALISPATSPAAGILLPLGFAMGPGVAFSIGQSWAAFGFEEGASVGLTMAAIGFLVAYVVGVAAVSRSGYAGSHLAASVRTGFRSEGDYTSAGRLTLSPAAVEPLAVHIALVACVYGLSFLWAKGLATGLDALGRPQEVPVVWSFHFILANLTALGVRNVLGRTRLASMMDNGLLDRLTGVMADYLIAASIMAISLGFALRYAGPIVLMVVGGSIVTYVALRRTARAVFREYEFERFVGMFGEMTGTVTSGLALIRILDPEYRSPVAQDLVLSSGVALGFAFPLLIAINLPFTMFGGSVTGFVVLLGVIAAYFVLAMSAWRLFYLKTRSQTQHS